mmetsp:Transcript_9892/g.36214  ORF Transcript_9892/g.36214 Transcript_9892/m.36214 type:complete len:1076 (-) Transcript_9892:1462-4689(-)
MDPSSSVAVARSVTALAVQPRSSSRVLAGRRLQVPLGRPSPVRLGSLRRRARSTRASATVNPVGSTEGPGADFPVAGDEPNPFGPEQPLTGFQNTIKGITGPTRLVGAAVLVGGAVAVGSGLAGAVVPQSARTAARAVGGVAFGAAGVWGAKQVDKKRKEIAAIDLHNTLVALGPKDFDRAHVDTIAANYEVDMSSECAEALKVEYDCYLSSVLPMVDTPLRGDEADRLLAFKHKLGISDGDAAQVHLEMGRRIFRQRLETGARTSEAAGNRKAFQKLVFVSTLVFGERQSRFLLPWKRIFDFNEAQVEFAMRENGSGLYRQRVAEVIGTAKPDEDVLRGLRNYQAKLGLDDDSAAEHLAAAFRKRIEANVATAYQSVKRRTRVRTATEALDSLEDILGYNKYLSELAAKQDPSLACGVGPATLYGGEYDSEARMGELKELYRTYLGEGIKDGELNAELTQNLEVLKTTFMLGTKEVSAIEQDVQSKVYRKVLRDSVKSGALKAEESKAKYLQALCDKLQFKPELAAAIHTDIYRTKLEGLLEKKYLTDEDAEALVELQVLLCIQQPVVDAAQKEMAGAIYKEQLVKVIGGGISGFGANDRSETRNLQKKLRLKDNVALELMQDSVVAMLNSFVTTSRSKANRVESAKELRNMVFFSNTVITPLLEDIKPDVIKVMQPPPPPEKKEGEEEEEVKTLDEGADDADEMQKQTKVASGADADAAIEEVKAKLKAKADAKAKAEGKEWVPASAQKAQQAATQEPQKYQGYFNLSGTMELNMRRDLYKNYLLFCLSGDVRTGPMGTQMVIERDQSEFVRLQQLGDLLGLGPADTANVHQGLAEQAFKQNVTQMLGDGKVTKEKSQYLKQLQAQLGLPDEVAQKVIKGVSNAGMIQGMSNAVAQGKLTYEEVKSMKEQEVDVETMLSEDLRSQLLRKTLQSRLAEPEGDEFDATAIVEEVADTLKVPEEKSEKILDEIGREQKKMSLVNAIAFLRQKNQSATVVSLKSLLACHELIPDQEVTWNVEEELLDLYSAFAVEVDSEEKRENLAALFKIDDDTRKQLDESVAAGDFTLEEEEMIF